MSYIYLVRCYITIFVISDSIIVRVILPSLKLLNTVPGVSDPLNATP